MDKPDSYLLEKAGQWAAHADEDLRWAEHGFELSGGQACKLIAYHAQQCVEKYLKAYLVLKGVDFPYTHNIAHLLELCAASAHWTDQLRDAEELTPFAISARYPADEDDVTESDARQSVSIARRVQDIVRQALHEEGIEK